MEQTDYGRYRGTCKEAVEAICAEDSTLTAVRGHYWCPHWGMQPHWWAVKQDGTIVDPTVKQFPTKGFAAEYIPFDGTVECSECGKKMLEEDAHFESNYIFCSGECRCRFVGL